MFRPCARCLQGSVEGRSGHVMMVKALAVAAIEADVNMQQQVDGTATGCIALRARACVHSRLASPPAVA